MTQTEGQRNILVLDVGTTGIKGFVFDARLRLLAKSYYRLKKFSIKPGWVEQDPQQFLTVSRKALRAAVKKSGVAQSSLVGLGITNQRETTIVWNKNNGKPVYPAIVWEDTRTAPDCERMKKNSLHEKRIEQQTGLALDPYFSATKIRWILDHVPAAQKLSRSGELLFGTVDSWILWNFLEDNPHVTDYTNASRTMLFDIKELRWDGGLRKMFGVQSVLLPGVKPSAGFFGNLKKDVLGFSLPVLAVCGDQEASSFAVGQETGMTKATYGTGAFVSQIIGSTFKAHDSFFTTLAAYVDHPVYAVEEKIDDCGKEVQKVLNKPVALKKVMTILTEKVAGYVGHLPLRPKRVVVDGGVTQYGGFARMQAKAAGVPVVRQKIYDGTALGAAMLVARQMKGAL